MMKTFKSIAVVVGLGFTATVHAGGVHHIDPAAGGAIPQPSHNVTHRIDPAAGGAKRPVYPLPPRCFNFCVNVSAENGRVVGVFTIPLGK